MYRKTRIVCVSDTHNASPTHGAFKLPKGDVLIHAGDMTNQGTYAELRKTMEWVQAADFEAKIVVAGNHDITLDEVFYAKHGSRFHNQCLQDSQACIDLFKNHPSITFLNHESAEIRLVKEGSARTKFKVFGSPYSPSCGLWAFGYSAEEAPTLWDQIPLGTDITITHTPPKYHCDNTKARGSTGCESLRQALWHVRPRLAVCGHVHEGRGADRVLWDLASPHVDRKELDTEHWIDAAYGTKKQSLIDLTRGEHWALSQRKLVMPTSLGGTVHNDLGSPFSKTSHFSDLAPPNSARHKATSIAQSELGRKETCIVNAAIMNSNWSGKTGCTKSYHKPVIVDIFLPTLE